MKADLRSGIGSQATQEENQLFDKVVEFGHLFTDTDTRNNADAVLAILCEMQKKTQVH